MGGAATEHDAAVDAIARMLGTLPPVLPASGRCAPLAPTDLTYDGKGGPSVPSVEIPLESLKPFPAIAQPLRLPDAPPPPRAAALLAPAPEDDVAPWVAPAAPAPVRARRWPYAIDAIVVAAIAFVAVLQSPLAERPAVRPYAEATRAEAKRAAHGASVAAVAGAHGASAWTVRTWSRVTTR